MDELQQTTNDDVGHQKGRNGTLRASCGVGVQDLLKPGEDHWGSSPSSITTRHCTTTNIALRWLHLRHHPGDVSTAWLVGGERILTLCGTFETIMDKVWTLKMSTFFIRLGFYEMTSHLHENRVMDLKSLKFSHFIVAIKSTLSFTNGLRCSLSIG
jgi:hypothetical protein